MKMPTRIALALLAIAAVVFSVPAAANADTKGGQNNATSTGKYSVDAAGRVTVQGSRLYFIAQHSGQCLNVEGASTAPGARLIQWPCQPAGSGNDEFLHDRGNIDYTLTPANNTLCLDIEGASVNPGSRLIQWTCNSQLNQEFYFYAPNPNDLYHVWIISTNSGLCLDVTGASQTPGTGVIQWSCNGQDNQLWYLGVL
jgi:hypothetical protein